MALNSDCRTVEVSQFNGIWLPETTGLDVTKIPANKGSSGANVQYFGDSVGTRLGHSTVFSPADVVRSMVNWLFISSGAPKNYLAWYKPGTGVRIADLASPSASTAVAEVTGTAACMLPNGARLYCAFMDANGLGVAGGQVYSSVGADPLFAPPQTAGATAITIVPTVFTVPPDPTVVLTPGTKRLGYLMQTRNGFITCPSPVVSDVFTSQQVVVPVSASDQKIQYTFTAVTFPSYVTGIIPIMTTSANPSQFFILPTQPGRSFLKPVTGGSPNTFNIFFAISDELLESAGTDATPYLNQLTQTVSGTPPILPFVIVPYGQRLVYLCLDSAGVPVAYASDSSAPQSINAATSGVYLPGNLPMTNAMSLRGVLYIMGPHWTYSTNDSGTVPAEWPEPQLVDGKVGAVGPFAIATNTSQNYAWVADQSGLYVFSGGSFGRPASYYQNADWSRINFAAPTCIQVADDSTSNRVHVLAPLDGASTPTHILTWDYTLGQDAESVKYQGACSLSGYSLGAIAMVQNATTKHMEKWVAPSNASMPIGRENVITDTNPFRDFGAAIDSSYETALLPKGLAGNLIMAHGAQMRVIGSGSLQVTAYSMDHASSAGPFSITLGATPGKEILQKFFLENEYVSLLFEINVLDSWFQLARVDFFYTLGPPQR